MAYSLDGTIDSFPAIGDLSARQYYAVTINSANRINTGSSTASVAFGVLLDDPNAADVIGAVMIDGVCPAACYGGDTAIAPGDSLTFNASGLLVKTTTDNAQIVGIAQEYLNDATPAFIAIRVQPARY